MMILSTTHTKVKNCPLTLIPIFKSVRMHEGGWPSQANQDLDSSQQLCYVIFTTNLEPLHNYVQIWGEINDVELADIRPCPNDY